MLPHQSTGRPQRAEMCPHHLLCNAFYLSPHCARQHVPVCLRRGVRIPDGWFSVPRCFSTWPFHRPAAGLQHLRVRLGQVADTCDIGYLVASDEEQCADGHGSFTGNFRRGCGNRGSWGVGCWVFDQCSPCILLSTLASIVLFSYRCSCDQHYLLRKVKLQECGDCTHLLR